MESKIMNGTRGLMFFCAAGVAVAVIVAASAERGVKNENPVSPKGRVTMANAETLATGKIPAIDAAAPALVETATFALG